MARGSAGLCFKSKCRAFTRVEISFDCSMQTGDVIEVKTGGNLGFLHDRSFFVQTYRNYCVTSHQPPKFQQRPFGNWIPDHCPRNCHRGTLQMSHWLSNLATRITSQEPTPTTNPPFPSPSSWWRLLGDSSIQVIPGGQGSGQIYQWGGLDLQDLLDLDPEFVRTTIPSISTLGWFFFHQSTHVGGLWG